MPTAGHPDSPRSMANPLGRTPSDADLLRMAEAEPLTLDRGRWRMVHAEALAEELDSHGMRAKVGALAALGQPDLRAALRAMPQAELRALAQLELPALMADAVALYLEPAPIRPDPGEVHRTRAHPRLRPPTDAELRGMRWADMVPDDRLRVWAMQPEPTQQHPEPGEPPTTAGRCPTCGRRPVATTEHAIDGAHLATCRGGHSWWMPADEPWMLDTEPEAPKPAPDATHPPGFVDSALARFWPAIEQQDYQVRTSRGEQRVGAPGCTCAKLADAHPTRGPDEWEQDPFCRVHPDANMLRAALDRAVQLHYQEQQRTEAVAALLAQAVELLAEGSA